MWVLQYNSEAAAEIPQVETAYIDSSYSDRPLLNIVEAKQYVGQRCLSGACMSDDCDRLASSNMERHVTKNPLFSVVSEPHMVKLDIHGALGEGNGSWRRYHIRCRIEQLENS